jgi:hypothetical protein
MVMTYKPFSQELYNDNDNAKDLAIKWLGHNGIEAWVNPNTYGIDLMSNSLSYEVEVKHNWRGSSFPFKTVHFPYRKMKFAKDDSMFIMFNHERTHALMIDGKLVAGSKNVTKDTIYTKGEKFIEVDVSDCKIHKLVLDEAHI